MSSVVEQLTQWAEEHGGYLAVVGGEVWRRLQLELPDAKHWVSKGNQRMKVGELTVELARQQL